MLPESIYEPAEDTYLLLEILEGYLQGKKNLSICEVGVGSGYIVKKLKEQFPENTYFASDINPDAISLAKESGVDAREGNLLEPFTEKFDVVYFNTPYLPCEDGEKYKDLTLKDKAIYGGKHGYEVIDEFISQVASKVKDRVFMLFSTLSHEEHIQETIRNHFLEFKEVKRTSHFFEELIVYEITKREELEEFEGKGIVNIYPFNHGKHSNILEGEFEGKKVIMKVGKAQHLEKEGYFLDKLQGESFVTTLLFTGETYVVYEKIEGAVIEEFIDNSSSEDLKVVLQNILDVCYRLDELGIQKFEMTNPYKHIFVQDDLSVKMIDFERSIFSENPKNTRQVLDYFRRNIPRFIEKGLKLDDEKMIGVGKKLKGDKFKVDLSTLQTSN